MRKAIPIFYSALLLTAVNLLLRFSGTGFQVFISNHLGAEGVGLLHLVLSVGGLTTTMAVAGIRTGAMYLTAEELGKKRPGNVRHVLSGCFTYSILINSAISISLYIAAPYIAEYWVGNVRTLSALRLFSAFIPVSCLCSVMIGYFPAANRIGALSAVEVVEQLCSMAVTAGLLLFWSNHDPIRSCKAVILGSSLGTCLTFGLLMTLRILEKPPHSSPIPIRSRLLQIAVPLAVADDLKSGLNTLENLMVPKRLSLHGRTINPLSAFGTVCGMVFPVLMFPAAILYALAELLLPELARCNAAGSNVRIRYLTRKSLRIAMLYGCLFSGLMILAAEPLCIRLYKSKLASYWLKRYAVLIPMLYCDAITDAMTKGLGQQTACVRYNILTSAMDVAGLYLLLPKYGMTGYYISFVITHALNFVLSIRRLLKITNHKPRLYIVLLSAAATAATIALCSFIPSRLWACICYPAVMVALFTLCNITGIGDLKWLKCLMLAK